MKVTKVDIDSLIFTLNKYLEQGIDYLDIEIIPIKNALKLQPSVMEEKTEEYE